MKPWSGTYPLRKGYSVRFTFDGSQLDCQWSPRLPDGKLGKKLLPDYRRGRDAFLSTLTPVYGKIAVVEL